MSTKAQIKDVLDGIREEILALPPGADQSKWAALHEVLQIIDRYEPVGTDL